MTERPRVWPQRWMIFTASLAVAAAAASIYFARRYFEKIAKGISELDDGEKLRAALGQLGDYYGGILNPLFGFVTIVLIFITLLLQRSELRAAQKELELQREQTEKQNRAIAIQGFEQTFFSWLNSYREIVANVHFGKAEGRRALQVMFNSFTSTDAIAANLAKNGGDIKREEWLKTGTPITESTEITVAEIVMEQWEIVYNNNAYQLDTLFRTLYNLVRWIDTQPEDIMKQQEKVKYVRILRSQISISEGYLLVLNALCPRGIKFVRPINKFALFDNVTPLPRSLELAVKHQNTNKLDLTAFNSTLARKAYIGQRRKGPLISQRIKRNS